MSLMSIEPQPPHPSAVLQGRPGPALPLEGCELSVDAACGLARVRFTQRFQNREREALSVTYRLPLPADASVSGFTFTVGGRRIQGRVEGRARARETFERALCEGRSAALLEQERTSLFTQEIGNIPPGEQVEVEVVLDQPLRWLAEGAWEWRFPLAAAPRYLGQHPSEGEVSLDVTSAELGARAGLSLEIRDQLVPGRSPESPSHPLSTHAGRHHRVELGSGNRVALDRDVVVRWPVGQAEGSLSLDVARPGARALSGSAFGLVTLVPPRPESQPRAVVRDVTILLDTSGSMAGEPLEQAKRIAGALIDSLSAHDQLEMIEFSSEARAFERRPFAADAELKRRAIAWVMSRRASGGTEMLSGVKSALNVLRRAAQRQIVLITDGLVGFEREIVRALLAELPLSARLHAVGVGSAVNRSLLAPVARAGRGIEALVGLGEDPERAAQRILSRMVAPQVVDLAISGSAVRRVVPSRLPDAYQGAPLLALVELDPQGGSLLVEGRTHDGGFSRSLRVEPSAMGQGSEAVVKLFGRELCEELEMRLSSGEASAAIDREIERTGLDFAIATRLTSWVAESSEVLVDPRSPSRHVVQPQALPYGMSADLGAARALPMMAPVAAQSFAMGRGSAPGMVAPSGMAPPVGGMAPPAGRPPLPAAPRRIQLGVPSADKDESHEERTRSAPMPQSLPAADRARREQDDAFASPPPPAPASPAAPRERELQEEAEAKHAAPKPKPLLERALDRVREAVGSKKKAASGAGSARIVAIRDGKVFVELVVGDTGLVLHLASARAELELADGSRHLAELIAEESTRDGRYAAGLVVRFVLRVPSDVHGEPRLARITLAGEGPDVTIEIEARR